MKVPKVVTSSLLPLIFALTATGACKGKAGPAPRSGSHPGNRPKRVYILPTLSTPNELVKLVVAVPRPSGFRVADWEHWIDHDSDCQDTRQEVLIEESESPVVFEDGNECVVKTGRWTCPYTGEVFTDPRKLAVDQLVGLAAVHGAGGHAWSPELRRRYANGLPNSLESYMSPSPEQLVAVSAIAKLAKEGKGPDEWLPSNTAFVCDYLDAWVWVNSEWELSVSQTEKRFILEQFGVRCDQNVSPDYIQNCALNEEKEPVDCREVKPSPQLPAGF